MANRTTIDDVRTVSVNVADQDRAVDFYVERLGFERRMDADLGGGLRWTEAAAPGATTSIALSAAQDATTAGVDTGIRFTATDVEAEHCRLSAAGVDLDDILRWPDVPAMFVFRDPDGNALYVVESLGGAAS